MALSKTDDCMKSVCGGGGTPAVVDNPCGGERGTSLRADSVTRTATVETTGGMG
jgi:hypothetical protein